MELLTATRAYRDLIAVEVERLELREGDRVADLGSGIGDLAVFLKVHRAAPTSLKIHSFDYVREGLIRQRARLAADTSDVHRVSMAIANLGVTEVLGLPLGTASCDAALAGLLLTYLPDPESFLAEVYRVLKPGGRAVVSGIRPDADVSKLYLDSIEELPPDRIFELFGDEVASNIPNLRRTFLSDASRIIDLEEFGYFQFWDSAGLVAMVTDAGFTEVTVADAFGDPAQAIVVQGRRP